MNFFDIRKLQAALSMIRVAFLKTGVEVDDVTLEKVLALTPGAVPISADTFAGDELAMNLNVESFDSQFIRANYIDIVGKINGVIVDSIFDELVNGDVKIYGDITKTELVGAIVRRIRSVLSVPSSMSNMAVDVFDSIAANLNDDDLISVVPFDEIRTVAQQSEAIALNTVVVADSEDVSLSCDKSTQLSGKIAIIARPKGTDIKASQNYVVITEATRVVPISKIAAEAVEIAMLKCEQVELQMKAKFIADVVSSSQFGSSFDISMSSKAALTPDAVTNMLANLGIDNVIIAKPDVDDSNIVKMDFVNISDVVRVGGRSAPATNIPASIKATFDIKSSAEIREKSALSIEPSRITEGTTIYAFVDSDSAAAITAMFKMFFGTQISLVNGSSAVRDIISTDIEADISTKVSVPASQKLVQDILNLTAKMSCRLGGRITQFLRDHNNKLLGEMNAETLGSLSIKEF